MLSKTNTSYTRYPNSTKYYLSNCGEKTPTTEEWLTVLKTLKTPLDYDKSRVLLSVLNDTHDVVVKVSDSNDIRNEYIYGQKLKSIKGFVKFICYFECNDDFRNYPSNTKKNLCKGPGNSMKIIVMPYYDLGSIASYKWSSNNINQFRSCLKQSIISIIEAFLKLNIIHGDFHPGNVVLKETKQKTITYTIENNNIEIATYGIRPWIMDFENTRLLDNTTQYALIESYDKFYYDLIKFFTFMPTFIKLLNYKSISPITNYISILNEKGKKISYEHIIDIFKLIDNIDFVLNKNGNVST